MGGKHRETTKDQHDQEQPDPRPAMRPEPSTKDNNCGDKQYNRQ